MRGGIDRLTDKAVRAFVNGAGMTKDGKRMLTDGAGLYLTMLPSRSFAWRLKYRYTDTIRGLVERVYAIGVWPEVSLAEAREKKNVVRAHLREGRDPMAEQRLERAAVVATTENTFGVVAGKWLERKRPEWSAVHFKTSKRALDRDVLPMLGKLPVNAITTPMVAACIDRIARRKSKPHETASRILQHVEGIFDLAATITDAPPTVNPALAVYEVLPKRKDKVRRPALLEWAPLGDLLRRAQLAHLSPAVHQAHRLVAFTSQRIGNIVTAKWEHFDLDSDSPSWTIPRDEMKIRHGRPNHHRALLGPTITNELKAWRQLTGGRGYLFPGSTGNDYITRESLEKAYRRTLGMSKQHSIHGWRSSFATLAKEADFGAVAVELALDHVGDVAIVRDYDRGERLAERRALAYWWDAQLCAAENGTTPISSRKVGAA